MSEAIARDMLNCTGRPHIGVQMIKIQIVNVHIHVGVETNSVLCSRPMQGAGRTPCDTSGFLPQSHRVLGYWALVRKAGSTGRTIQAICDHPQ